jgi:hypothetical protein
VVDGISWSDYGTTVTITIDYTWNPSGEVRTDHEQRLLVELSFKLVQEFTLRNDLPHSVLADPSLLSWSHSELSLVVVRDDERSATYDHDQMRFHHAVLRREGSTWMEVVFAQLEISERVAPARNR